MEAESAGATEKKSGLRKLKSGEILFNENDPADSLYIIQKGQIRLFKPKGKGFIELAVLRAGEVIGEMAFFDTEGGSRRSCSAQAIAATEAIEISFKALDKTMATLNPWFKTIIETLAQRLRKTNARVKELESNQVGGGYGKEKGPEYHYFRGVDIVRMMSVIFLSVKSHGTLTANGLEMHKNLLRYYAIDIFALAESKYEELLILLGQQELIKMIQDESKLANIVCVADIELIRNLLVFFNNQRIAPDEKKIKLSRRTEVVMDEILAQVAAEKLQGEFVEVDLSKIFDYFKYRNMNYDLGDLEEAQKQGFMGEPIIGAANAVKCQINLSKISKVYRALKLQNVFEKYNEEKNRAA